MSNVDLADLAVWEEARAAAMQPYGAWKRFVVRQASPWRVSMWQMYLALHPDGDRMWWDYKMVYRFLRKHGE